MTEDLRDGGWAPGLYVIDCIDCVDVDWSNPSLGAKGSVRCKDHARWFLWLKDNPAAEDELVRQSDPSQGIAADNTPQGMLKKHANPTPLAGCYDLHLYCDHENPDHGWDEFPHAYTDEFGSACRAEARRDGWVIHRDNTATCPKCSRSLK